MAENVQCMIKTKGSNKSQMVHFSFCIGFYHRVRIERKHKLANKTHISLQVCTIFYTFSSKNTYGKCMNIGVSDCLLV